MAWEFESLEHFLQEMAALVNKHPDELDRLKRKINDKRFKIETTKPGDIGSFLEYITGERLKHYFFGPISGQAPPFQVGDNYYFKKSLHIAFQHIHVAVFPFVNEEGMSGDHFNIRFDLNTTEALCFLLDEPEQSLRNFWNKMTLHLASKIWQEEKNKTILERAKSKEVMIYPMKVVSIQQSEFDCFLQRAEQNFFIENTLFHLSHGDIGFALGIMGRGKTIQNLPDNCRLFFQQNEADAVRNARVGLSIRPESMNCFLNSILASETEIRQKLKGLILHFSFSKTRSTSPDHFFSINISLMQCFLDAFKNPLFPEDVTIDFNGTPVDQKAIELLGQAIKKTN